jgi:hypothetical protein
LNDKGQRVSQDVRKSPPWAQGQSTAQPETATPDEAPVTERPEVPDPAVPDDVTVGTGSVIAYGCIAGTLLLILIGLLYLGLIAIF